MIWKTSMWTQLFGVYLCLSLFKLQFILGKFLRTMCDLPRINTWIFLKQLFQMSERLITDQIEITGLTTIDWKQLMWRERDNSVMTTLLCDRAVQICEFQNLRLFRPSALSGRHQWQTSRSLGKQDQVVFGNTPSQRFGSNRRRANGGRLDNFPGFTSLRILDEIQKMMWTRAIQRKDHLHVNVHWHCMERTRKQSKLFSEFCLN